MIVDEYPNNRITIKGNSFLYFGGTDYLGIQQHNDFISIIHQNLKKWGASFGSSRDNNIKLAIYDEFESYFADFLNQESSVSVSSGTLAGYLVKEYYATKNVNSFHIHNSHPAIILPDSQVIFTDKTLHPDLVSNKKETVIISSDAILALQTATANFDFLDEIHHNKEVILFLDESHSLGILGINGQGISSNIKHPIIKQKIIISSLSKAYGVSGGILSSDTEFIETIKNLDIFSGAAGMNPAILQSVLDAKSIYIKQLKKLKHNLTYFYSKLPKLKDWNFTTNYPVIYYPKEFKEQFFKNSIITTNFKYQNNEVNRIVIKANHTIKDIDLLLDVILKTKK
ncbi:MAG: aminotransferase class I/II-fold pyridoxal phosphate-dependent enzyme [Flavobacteriaceae bacterium]